MIEYGYRHDETRNRGVQIPAHAPGTAAGRRRTGAGKPARGWRSIPPWPSREFCMAFAAHRILSCMRWECICSNGTLYDVCWQYRTSDQHGLSI